MDLLQGGERYQQRTEDWGGNVMLFYILLILGIIFAIIFLIGLIESIIKKDSEMLPCLFFPLFLATVCIVGSDCLKERVGIVCSVEKVQTSYTQTIIDGEIEQVPVYSYLILFQTEDGKYRTFTTTNINYSILKEGDSITYTLDSTKKD